MWLARDFLRTAGRPIDITPCACSADLCPPIKTEENEMTTTPSLPTRFTLAQQAAALQALGIDTLCSVASVTIYPDRLTIVTHDLDDQGRTVRSTLGGIAMTTTIIPLTD